MVMPDHQDWPPTYSGLHSGARCLGYLVAAVAGLDTAFTQPDVSMGIHVIGFLVAVGGVGAFIGTLFRRWMIELVTVFSLTGLMLAYTVADWAVLVFDVGYPPLSMALIAIGSGLCVVAAVATGKYRYRWAALLGATVVIALAVPLSARNPAIVTLVTCLLFARALELKLFRDQTVRAGALARLSSAGT